MKKSLFTFVIFTLFSFIISAQNTDLKLNENISKETIKFQFIKNLIIIPIKLNGHEMNFIVDSGLRETILFSQFDNTIDHNSLKKIKLKGLGKDENGTTGYLSSGNKLMIGKNLISEQSTVIIIQDEYFNLFSRLGIEVHGIIGYDIFKNYALEIDYPNQKITFYKTIYRLKKLKKYASSDIEISPEKKPFLKINFKHFVDYYDQKMLIDLGNSDGLWLFENEIRHLKQPNDVFLDELGKGFSGVIYGARGTIENANIGNSILKKPLIAIPDSESIQSITIKNNRKGSVGNEILRRFSIILDYPNQKIYLKTNKNFKDPFHYNRSGLTIVHANFEWKKETVGINLDPKNNNDSVKTAQKMNYQYVLKPVYKIEAVRKNSNADRVGLKAGDQLEKLNNKNITKMNLTDIEHFMQNNEHQQISVDILRNNVKMKFEFVLDIPYLN